MAKVLIFANDNSTIYNFRRELLSRLINNGDEVLVALPPHPRNQAFRDLGCEVIETPLSRFGTNPLSELVTLTRFVRIVRQSRPGVVLTYTVKPNIYGGLAAQLCKVPYIATVTGLGAVFQNTGLLRKVSSLLQRFAFRKAHRVFFQNADNFNTFRELQIVKNQGRVLPGSGVNLALHQFEPYPTQSAAIRFITVSRIRHDKGYDELFTAIKTISSRHDDVEFHVVGWYEDDSYRATVTQMQSDFPVIFHEEVTQEQVHELVAESHCLIHPSHHEGMANVILEAAAAGRPCIASDIPGCREAIEPGTTGLLHRVNDADSLILAVESFLDSDWETKAAMGKAAHQKMTSEFDRELVVDHYIDEIRQATHKSGVF